MRREKASVGLTFVDAVYVLLGAALAIASAWPIYQTPQVVWVGLAGIGVGLVCAVGGGLLRLPWWVDLIAAIALFLLVAVPFAIPSAFPDRWFTGLRDAVFSVVTGWKDLVTVSLPLGDYQAVLVPFLAIMLFGTYAAARIASSANRARIVAPVILVGMFAFGIAFGANTLTEPFALGWIPVLPIVGIVSVAQVQVVGAILLVVLSLVWLSVRARRVRAEALARAAGLAQAGVAVRRASGWAALRRALVAVAMVAVAVVAAGFAAVPAAQAQREVIRTHVTPIELTVQQTSPLSGYRTWFSDDNFNADLFTVAAPKGVDRIRLAVMDKYDGNRFTVSTLDDQSRFSRIHGTALSNGTPVTVTFAAGYSLPWVPLPGDRTSSVSFTGSGQRAVTLEDSLYYSDDDSLALELADRPDGGFGFGAGDVLTVSGAVPSDPRAAIAQLAGSDKAINGVEVTPDDKSYLSLAEWVTAQEDTGVTSDHGGGELLALIDRLRLRGYLSHGYDQAESASSRWFASLAGRSSDYEFEQSRPGESVQRIIELFDQLNTQAQNAPAGGGEAGLVAGIGDDEQFATAAALLAWHLGIEARVVLGVRLQDEPASQSTPAQPAQTACAAAAGKYTCKGQNVSAWIEVQVGGQWLPIDTSPQFTSPMAPQVQNFTHPEYGTQPERRDSNAIDPPDATRTAEQGQAAPERTDGPVVSSGALAALRTAAVAGTAAGLLVIPPFVLVGAKGLRRRRRRTGQPEVAIVGAWEELIDECVDLRLIPRAAGGTRSQLAERLDDPVARQLAAAADRAVFGSTAPAESDSLLAWRMVREEQKRLRRDVPFWQRVRGKLNPASFIRHLRPTSARITLDPNHGGDDR